MGAERVCISQIHASKEPLNSCDLHLWWFFSFYFNSCECLPKIEFQPIFWQRKYTFLSLSAEISVKFHKIFLCIFSMRRKWHSIIGSVPILADFCLYFVSCFFHVQPICLFLFISHTHTKNGDIYIITNWFQKWFTWRAACIFHIIDDSIEVNESSFPQHDFLWQPLNVKYLKEFFIFQMYSQKCGPHQHRNGWSVSLILFIYGIVKLRNKYTNTESRRWILLLLMWLSNGHLSTAITMCQLRWA